MVDKVLVDNLIAQRGIAFNKYVDLDKQITAMQQQCEHGDLRVETSLYGPKITTTFCNKCGKKLEEKRTY